MAEIAIDLERALTRRRQEGAPGRTMPRILAQGAGWSVSDVLCTSGPHDRPYEERHTSYVIAIVLAGSFQYRSSAGRSLLTPGSLMLGNAGQCFECGHEHAEGDRCVSFRFSPDYFEQVAADLGARGSRFRFRVNRVPPLRLLSPVVVQAALGARGAAHVCWEELATILAARTIAIVSRTAPAFDHAPPASEARVTRILRAIEQDALVDLALPALAAQAHLSAYHFLRTFERLTGVTPHQYLLRIRLRKAALRLAGGNDPVIDVAFDSGFGDVSNFNRAFRAEFGTAPRAFRRAAR